MMTTDPPRVGWFTNLPAPYRLPVWRELAGHLRLEVLVLAANEWNRTWMVPASEPYPLRQVPTINVRVGERVLYKLRHRALSNVRQFDIVILPGWDNPAAWQIMRMARANGIGVLAFNESTPASGVRNGWRSKPLNYLRKEFHRQVDGVITVGSQSSALMRSCGVPSERIYETRNCVDVDSIKKSVESARSVSAGDPKKHRFLFVGQLIPRKRPDLPIRALPLLKNQNVDLTIVGSGALQLQLAKLIAELGVGDICDLLGHQQERGVREALARSHTLILPSESEVWGLVVNEAIAAGLHVVVSDRCGITSDIADVRGVFATACTVEDVTRQMAKSLRAWNGYLYERDGQFRPEDFAATVARAVREIAT